MTVLDYLVQYAHTTPDAIALQDSKKQVITYKELLVYIINYSNYLSENLCSQGSVVVLKVTRQQDWIIAFLSLLALGCWIVPISDKLSPYELEAVIETTNAKAVLDDDNPTWEIVKENQSPIHFSLSHPCGILHMTSGSTGKPKYCIRSIESLTSEAQSFITTFAITSLDIVLSVPPLYHSFALGAALMTTLTAGACLYNIDRFVPREVLRILTEESITILLLVPIIAKMLCDTYTPWEADLSLVRIALTGAGAISEELYSSFRNKFGICLQANYGSTETGGVISRIEPEPRQSIGKVMAGVEFKIITEEGNKADVMEVGELWIRCCGMLKGYYGTYETGIDSEGYFPMGDMVNMDTEGFLYIKGRKKSIIKVGGEKVDPFEVEEVLKQIPGMKECIVVGIRKSNDEERVKAVVVCEGLTEDLIRKHCTQKLTDYKIPAVIEFRKKLPRNELGKIKREDLMGS